ncbi:MAG: formylglycine-generating enzyme family protein [Rhodopirellula sp.]|nr:formylglycine-generating enzyme family protein [Rhodopirellula sp.]
MWPSPFRQLAVALLVLHPAAVGAAWANPPDFEASEKGLDSGVESRLWAVVVGVTTYLDPAVRAWESGVPDARLVYGALVERAGYSAERVLLITDDQPKPHLRPLGINLRTQISAWLAHAAANDTVLLFYAGRAFVRPGGRAYLAPQECESAQPEATALSVDDLREMLIRCRARRKLVILGAGSPSQPLAEALQTVVGLTALACCRQGETPLVAEGKKETAFSASVARALSGEADANGDQFVDSEELCRFLNRQVQAAAGKGADSHMPFQVSGKGVEVVPVAKFSVKPEPQQLTGSAQHQHGPSTRQEAVATGGTSGGSQLPKHITNSIGMKLVLIPAGEFMMGSPDDEIGHKEDESPQHKVRITKAFYMGVYEVTRAEFAEARGSEVHAKLESRLKQYFQFPGSYGYPPEDYFQSDRYPQLGVNWEDAVRFCRELTAMPDEKRAGRNYRLPTEAEWEYACRGGTTSPFNVGHDADTEYFSFNGSPYGENGLKSKRKGLLKVGSYQPNSFGLCDMHGNALEWCFDYYKRDYYTESPSVDPRGPLQKDARLHSATTGGYYNLRVLRGGHYRALPAKCRSAARQRDVPQAYTSDDDYISFGFRVVCDP